MIPVVPILINISNMNEAVARSITDTFITNFSKVKHGDVNSFFKDLQPICKSMKCKARFVNDASIEINEAGTSDEEDKYVLNVVASGKEEHEFNCILTLNKGDDSLYTVNTLYLFVPSEHVSGNKSCSINISIKKGGNDDGSESADDRESGDE